MCPIGTQGNPFISCVTGHCQYNEDCADHEACDRLNRVCRPVCDSDTCAPQATCIGRHHQPDCLCRPGTTGNPFVQCSVLREPSKPPRPECTVDADCPSQLACFDNHCANPCDNPNVCSAQQTCSVLDTLPLRTVICKCPSDMIADNSRNCVPVKHDTPACQVNEDCADPEVCQRGVCITACHVEQCGINAQCLSRNHYAHCSCPPGYEGNPRIECHTRKLCPGCPAPMFLISYYFPYPAAKTPSTTPPPECYKNDDCPSDRTCHNERCVNPCAESNPCGRGAFCHAENRQAVCRCPVGYLGNPYDGCIPRKCILATIT